MQFMQVRYLTTVVVQISKQDHMHGNTQTSYSRTRQMTNFVTTLKDLHRYNRTVREIQKLPNDIALDLGIYKGDAHAIAAMAVYGK